MSISIEIQAKVREEVLYLHEPYMPARFGAVPREMYVTQQIKDLFDGPWVSEEWEARCGFLMADLDNFVQGARITVAAKTMSGGGTSYMRQLFPRRREVWEVRSRKPQPGIRILGRFAGKDVFIATNWWLRADLGGPESRAWRDAIIEAKTQWRNLFPAYEPQSSGEGCNDYVGSCLSNYYII